MRRLAFVVLASCATEPPPLDDIATGELGAWQTAAPLPTARANHCSAVIDDWLLVIGGNHMSATGFVKTDEIHAARVATDGTLGAWVLAGHTPSPVTECNAASDGRKLYVIDGLYDDESAGRKIWTATLDDAGALSPMTMLGALPEGVIAISSEATVKDGTLLLMDSQLPAEGDKTVTWRTKTDAIAWSMDDWKIGFRAQAQYAFGDSFMFTLGGYTTNTVTSDVFAARIDTGGALGTITPTTPLPEPVAFGEAVAVDEYVFVAGGRGQIFGAPGTNKVFAAHVAEDGSLGAWQASELPMQRTNHELAVIGDFLALTGGAANGPGDTTVLLARVRYPQTH